MTAIQNNLALLIQKAVRFQFQNAYQQKFKRNIDEANHNVLAGFCLIDEKKNIQILSIGFGTKSLPYSLCIEHGPNLLKDMHAQILANRGLRKWILKSLPIKQMQNKYFKWDFKRKKHQFKIQNYKLVLYSSQIFCGDCMIDEQSCLFSGAKPLSQFGNDIYGQNKYQKNILRTKPGRLDLPKNKKSLSLSCSDKISLWNILGVQGKYLFNLIIPIYINQIYMRCPEKYLHTITNGINIVYRLSYLKNKPQVQILRKIFNIIVNNKEKQISYQFRHQKPAVYIINQQSIKQKQKTMDICGVIINNKCQWLTGKIGLKQGSSLNNYKIKGGISEYSSLILYKDIQLNPLKFQYKAIKERIKILFGIWTDIFKDNKIEIFHDDKFQ